MQFLRHNTGSFKKDKAFTSLILVRNREELTGQLTEVQNDINNEEIEENDNIPGKENQDIMEENEQTSQEESEGI